MIVDDELEILYGIHSIIDWKSLGLSVSSLCLSGEDAFEAFSKHPSDIVITDIKMPGISGLDLAQKVLAINPNTVVIMLTSYSDYSLMRTAIDIHVFSYLLKPIDEVEMRDTLAKAIKQLDGRRNAVPVSSHESDYSPAEHSESFLKLMFNPQAIEESERLFLESEISRVPLRMLAACLDSAPLVEDAEFQRKEAILFKAVSVFLQNNTVVYFAGIYNGFCIYLFSDSIDAKSLQSIRAYVRRVLSESYSAQLTGPISAFDHFSVIRKKSLGLFKHRMFFGDADRDYLYRGDESFSPETFSSSSLLENYKAPLEKSIISEDVDSLRSILVSAGEYLRSLESSISEHDARISYSLLALHSLSVFERKSKIESSLAEDYRFQIMAAKEFRSLNAMVSFLVNLFCVVMRDSSAFCYQDLSDSLRAVIKYLNEHYSEPIALEDTAKRFFLNPSYLSRLFHKETGVTFATYVTDLRMNQAKVLLSDTNLIIHDVAAQCGYSSESSFYSAFKKSVGCSPNEYRKNARTNFE